MKRNQVGWWWIILIVFEIAAIGTVSILFWQQYQSQLSIKESSIRDAARRTESMLNDVLQHANQTLMQEQPYFAASKGAMPAIRERMLSLSMNTYSQVRFNWVNAQDRLVIGARLHNITPDYDLSRRDYIASARKHPGIIHSSGVISHIAQSTPIMVQAIGITHGAEANYVGALIATIDLEQLKPEMMRLLMDCECIATVIAPDGTVIYQSGNQGVKPTNSNDNTSSFTVQAEPTQTGINHVKAEMLTQSVMWWMGINLLGGLIAWWLYQRYLKPISSTLADIAHTPSHKQAITLLYSRSSLEEQLQSLRYIAECWQASQSRLKQQELTLQQCMEQIRQLREQQSLLMRISSQEMQAMFQTVCDYACHLEEMVLAKQLDPDAPYDFDDVREHGENLGHLSGCFLMFCEPLPVQHTRLEVKPTIEQLMDALSPMFERRNLSLQLDAMQSIMAYDPYHTLMPTLRSLLYSAISHAEDEAQLLVKCYETPHNTCLELSVSQFRQSLLPVEEQNFSMFVPAMHKDMQQSILQSLHDCANLRMADAFVRQLKGTLRIEVSHQRFTLQLCLVRHWQHAIAQNQKDNDR